MEEVVAYESNSIRKRSSDKGTESSSIIQSCDKEHLPYDLIKKPAPLPGREILSAPDDQSHS